MLVVGWTVDVGRYAVVLQTWTGALGMLAPVGYVAIYLAVTLSGVPGTPFTLLAPFLFGVWPAFAVMVVASALSAAAAFLIARHLARDMFVERLARADGFRRLSALVEDHDWMVIPLLRVLPVAPFAVINYGFGLTGIGFWRYLGWSLLAMVPMNALLVLGADLFYRAAAWEAISWPQLGVAAAAALLVLAVVAGGRRAFARS